MNTETISMKLDAIEKQIERIERKIDAHTNARQQDNEKGIE